MTTHVSIIYQGATLTVPGWLAPLWPHDLPLHRWPSFCGAGCGWGDRIVPESIKGVKVSPACFIHDVDWSTSPDSIGEFTAANWRFFRNCAALINRSHELSWIDKKLAVARAATLWLGAVSTIGALCYDPLGSPSGDPLDNPDVQEKLRRLATSRIDWQRIQEEKC